MCDDNKRLICGVGILALAALAVLHAITLTVAERAAPRVEQYLGFDEPMLNAPVGGYNWDQQRTANGARSTLPVNPAARDEIKQQQRIVARDCVPCTTTQTQYTYPNTAPTLPNQSTISNVKAVPTTQDRYHLDLFVSTDAQSQQLLKWFNTNTELQNLKKNCTWQVYTPSNALYRARYASIIPEDQFPALLFSAPDGGHIHAVTRSVFPASDTQLAADLKVAHQLQKEVVQSRPTLTQQLPTVSNDCADGTCEPREPLLNPNRPRVLPRLFDTYRDQSVQGILRMLFNPAETILNLVLIAVVVVLAIAVLRRR